MKCPFPHKGKCQEVKTAEGKVHFHELPDGGRISALMEPSAKWIKERELEKKMAPKYVRIRWQEDPLLKSREEIRELQKGLSDKELEALRSRLGATSIERI